MGLQLVYQETFHNQVMRIDGYRFENCRFEKCLLEYGGAEEVAFVGCTLRDVDWSFVGAASNTINFLTGLYNGFGSLGQQVTEELFDSIRRGDNQLPPAILAAQLPDAAEQKNLAYTTAQIHGVGEGIAKQKEEAHQAGIRETKSPYRP